MERTNFQKGDGSGRQQDVLLALPTGTRQSQLGAVRIVLRQAKTSKAKWNDRACSASLQFIYEPV